MSGTRLTLGFLNYWSDKGGNIALAKIMKPLCLVVYFFDMNFHMSCCIAPSATASISSHNKLYLVLPENNQGPDDSQQPHQPRKQERSQVPSRLQVGAKPLYHFTYLLIMPIFWVGISDLPLAHRRIILFWPAGFLEVKFFIWTNIYNQISFAVWQQWGWLLYRPFHFGNSWSWGDPRFLGFKKNLVPRVCERTARPSVFLVGVGSVLCAQSWTAFWTCSSSRPHAEECQ